MDLKKINLNLLYLKKVTVSQKQAYPQLNQKYIKNRSHQNQFFGIALLIQTFFSPFANFISLIFGGYKKSSSLVVQKLFGLLRRYLGAHYLYLSFTHTRTYTYTQMHTKNWTLTKKRK